MKKLFKTILSIAALTTALGFFASCGEGVDDADIAAALSGAGGAGGYKLPEGAVPLQLYEKTGDEVTDSNKKDVVTIGADCAKPFAFVKESDLTNVKVGAKIYFTLECADGESMRLQNWDWAYLSDKIIDDETNQQVTLTPSEYNGQTDYNLTKSGHYYFEVTADVKTKLAKAIEIHGNKAKLSKFAYVNPAE